MHISLLTGGGDRPYVVGLATTLIRYSVSLDIIGSDGLNSSEWHSTPGVRFFNLRGDQKVDAPFFIKVKRILVYYSRLIFYAWRATPNIFHILWNNKFESIDRTLLMLYYRVLGKRVVLTAHNINKSKRDSTDTLLNRFTLWIQYRLCHHVFVHNEGMKRELMNDFGGKESAITVIPFGINNAVPQTDLTSEEAKERLRICKDDQCILFFGRIAPYKGLEFLASAFKELARTASSYRLIIAGRPDNDSKEYCRAIEREITNSDYKARVLLKIEFVPDNQTEIYFKAADVLVLPYKHIYQSGVLFLAYSFGLPVIASDVGSLREEIVEGRTGFVCKAQHPDDLAKVIEHYFASDLYHRLDRHRQAIREYACARYSWDQVGKLTVNVYRSLLDKRSPDVECQSVR
jgi:D-inositol-3-phosphate glycosyltransferase